PPLRAGFQTALNTNRTNPPRVGGGGPEQGRRADRTRQPKNTQTDQIHLGWVEGVQSKAGGQAGTDRRLERRVWWLTGWTAQQEQNVWWLAVWVAKPGQSLWRPTGWMAKQRQSL